jgi:hypothetical protein
MGLKVSDEYTLPLCNIHHDDVHRTGDERAWWARHGIIEPLKYAARLWGMSRQRRDPAASGEVFDTDRDRELTPTHRDGVKREPGKDPGTGLNSAADEVLELRSVGILDDNLEP